MERVEIWVDLRDELNAVTPRLRRYARALTTGSPAACDLADDLVHATLMRALGARYVGGDLTIRLYATVTQLHRELACAGSSAVAVSAGRPSVVSGTAGGPSESRHGKVSAGLLSLPVEQREALLLVTLEGFDHGDASRILRISRAVLLSRLTQARTKLEDALKARPAARASRAAAPYLRLVT